jgi:LacI family transcriptional regulator
MVRLVDIAGRAGVSVMTVSKVLRDAPDISASTKARVRQIAQEMGYVPDALAQGLRTRTTRLLGLVIPGLTQPLFPRMVLAIEERSFEMGYDLLFGHSMNLIEREEAILRRLFSRRVDGLLIWPAYQLAPSSPVYEEIHRRGLPTVILGHAGPFCSKFVSIESDDVAGAAAATQHLIEHGHRRIALFSGPVAAPWARERMEGYRGALRQAQIDVDERLVFTAGGGIEDGAKAALQMLHEGALATAVLAANDLVAIGAAETLMQQGLRIPQDVSIVGYGNTPIAEHFRVPLTTVRQPKYRLGQAAIDIMAKLLRGERPPTLRLAAQLEVRASSGPSPAAQGVPGA